MQSCFIKHSQTKSNLLDPRLLRRNMKKNPSVDLKTVRDAIQSQCKNIQKNFFNSHDFQKKTYKKLFLNDIVHSNVINNVFKDDQLKGQLNLKSKAYIEGLFGDSIHKMF